MGAESQTGGERWTVLDAFGDAALVHVAAPEAELFHFAAQDGDGPLAVRHQLLQVLVAQFLAGAALARALSAPLGCVHNKKKNTTTTTERFGFSSGPLSGLQGIRRFQSLSSPCIPNI